MSNTSQIHTESTESNNVVERKIEKYISYFTVQPRIQGYSNSVKADLDRLREYSSITSTLDTQSQWITK
jgi:hypothetical protein